jgi:hypothetical protein
MAAELSYDLTQLLDVAHLLSSGDAALQAEHNARVESFMIRFRTLLEFFYRPTTFATDVRAWEYFGDPDPGDAQDHWAKVRPEAHATFGVSDDWLTQAVIVRVGHASVDRLYKVEWPAEFMAIGMARVWITFLGEIDPDYRSSFESHMRHEIEVLPDGSLRIGPRR